MIEIKGVKIEYLGHDGFLFITKEGKRIAIDPYNINDHVKKVDLVLITHSHYDHCSLKDIDKLLKDDSEIVIPVDCQSKINKILRDRAIKVNISTVGLKLKASSIDIYPFPAYNINKEFHPKEEGWMGYLIKLGNLIIYHAGDTDKIPEMENLSYIAQEGEEVVALLPVSGKYVMDAQEAAQVAFIIKPNIAIPMHYGQGVVEMENGESEEDEAKKFVELCTQKGINAKILTKAVY